PAGDAVAPPYRAGGDGDVLEIEVDDVLGAHPALAVDLDIWHRIDGLLPVVKNSYPGREAGQPGLLADSTAKVTPSLREHYLVAAQAERARRLKPCGTRANDQDPRVGAAFPDALRVPAAPELLSHARVLRAPDRRHREVAGHADVAADA